MTKFADLLKKPAPKEKKILHITPNEPSPLASLVTKSTPAEPVNPMAALKQTLAGLKKPTQLQQETKPVPLPASTLPPTQHLSEAAPVESTNPNTQFENPTMTDISNYVFEEQPDESTLELTDKFDILLSELSVATGNDIPDLLAKNLLFIKEHPFLAEILKPDSIGHLCNAMRKSYGHVVQAKTERTAKTKARSAKETAVLDSLAGISF